MLAKLLKQTLKYLLICMAISALVLVNIFFNLTRYAVYYARHTPHASSIDPVTIELMDNLYFDANPSDELQFNWKKAIFISLMMTEVGGTHY